MTNLHETKMTLSDLPDEFYKGKTVFVRVDFNVPINIKDIKEDYRLRRSISTIEYLVKRKAKIIIGSHLGRPEGKRVKELSLNPVKKRLSIILDRDDILFADDCIGVGVKKLAASLVEGQILVLENLRFHKGELDNDSNFAKELSSIADIYVNDAFSTSHRMHASTYGIGKYFDHKLAGFLVKKEMEVFSRVRDNPDRPYMVVVGGLKIKDKINALKNLISKADKILIGGCLAYTFLASKNVSTGNSFVEKEYIDWAKEILSKNSEKILLPVDHVVVSENRSEVRLVPNDIPIGYMGLDIGPKTTSIYTHELINNKGTIFWNGPMGLFEDDDFSHGTVNIARAISVAYWRGTNTYIGGGDTVASLRKAEVMETEVDYVSTGGGATLEFLGGTILPGLSILDNYNEYKISA